MGWGGEDPTSPLIYEQNKQQVKAGRLTKAGLLQELMRLQRERENGEGAAVAVRLFCLCVYHTQHRPF